MEGRERWRGGEIDRERGREGEMDREMGREGEGEAHAPVRVVRVAAHPTVPLRLLQ